MKKRRKLGKTIKRFWPLYLMFMPGVVYLFINCYIPMFGIQIAFRSYNARFGLFGSPWCGLNNFKFLFRTKDAYVMIRNTLLYNFVFIALGTILSVAVAIILNEIRNKMAKQVYQTLILVPYLISMVIISYLVFAFLSTSNGFINNSLQNYSFFLKYAIVYNIFYHKYTKSVRFRSLYLII